MTENWKPIPGYTGFYEVSDLGHIRRIRFGQGARKQDSIKHQQLHAHRAYPTVKLCKFGLAKTHRVHSLVAAAFLGVRPSKYEVNHRNGNKLDARLCNLEYCTPSQNAQHAHRILGIPGTAQKGERNGCSKLSGEHVLAIRKVYSPGYGSLSRLARKFGVTPTAIWRIVHRINWRHI